MTLPPHLGSDNLAQKFASANEHWNLDKLYRDIANAKQQERRRECKQLTQTEKACLRGLLSGYSPTEIATQLNREPNGLRVELSRGLYRYIETSTDTYIKGWYNISKLLEKAGYKLQHNCKKRHIDQADEPAYASGSVTCNVSTIQNPNSSISPLGKERFKKGVHWSEAINMSLMILSLGCSLDGKTIASDSIDNMMKLREVEIRQYCQDIQK